SRAARATARGKRAPGHRPFGDPPGGLRRARGADADSAQSRRAAAHREPARRERGAALPAGAHQARRSVRPGERRALRGGPRVYWAPAMASRRKVLFVEDESALRRTYKRFFAARYDV